MRAPLATLALASLVAASFFGATAFNAADVAPRGVAATIIGDAAAYLRLEANSVSPHRCFVAQTAGGELFVDVTAPSSPCSTSGGGLGLNEGIVGDSTRITRYAFHELLRVTNQGTRPVLLWANATTSSGDGSLVEVARIDTLGAMRDAMYGATNASAITLGVGSSAYVGLRLGVGELTSGSAVEGSVTLSARAS